MTRSKIVGTGMAVPRYIMTNDELATIVDTSDTWIRERTGIRQRHIARDGETCVSLAAQAAREALDRAGLKASDLDMIIFASLTPNRVMPSAACDLGTILGAGDAMAFDITAACSGFVFSLSIADQFIRTGLKKRVLCIGAEVLSAYINWEDRNTCVLFGDGAGAAVLTATQDTDKSHLMSFHMYSNGSHGDLLCIPSSGSAITPTSAAFRPDLAKIQMRGKDLFRHAVTGMIRVGLEALERNNVKPDDIDLFIPHQANTRIMEAVRERLGIASEKTMVNLDKYGNTSAATIPMAFHEAILQRRCQSGDLILLDAFGGGLTYGSCLLRL